jgi:hypothetical protein
MKFSGAIDFNAPVVNYGRKDFPLLEAGAAAGPATFALANMFALLFYFTSAWLVLQ